MACEKEIRWIRGWEGGELGCFREWDYSLNFAWVTERK